jgi:hypothetical protein
MSGLSETDFDQMKAELDREWTKASSRDEGLRVIVTFGQRFGYKNVMAALQGRLPKRFTSGTDLEQWKAEQRAGEVAGE